MSYVYNGMMNAPDFSLPDQDGKIHTLKEYRGRWVILYYYPKDDTPGCTKEACSFRDNSGVFTNRGAQVLGVSRDSVASHKKFAEKYRLNFPLLSDETGDTVKAYHAWGEKKIFGKRFEGILRTTYLIDPEGRIAKKYEKVNPLVHSGQILSDLETLIKM